jgi:hypothetical protein
VSQAGTGAASSQLASEISRSIHRTAGVPNGRQQTAEGQPAPLAAAAATSPGLEMEMDPRFAAGLDGSDDTGADADTGVLHSTVSLVASHGTSDEEEDALRQQPSELSRLEARVDRLQAQNDELTDQIESLLGIKVCTLARLPVCRLVEFSPRCRRGRSDGWRRSNWTEQACSTRCFPSDVATRVLPLESAEIHMSCLALFRANGQLQIHYCCRREPNSSM